MNLDYLKSASTYTKLMVMMILVATIIFTLVQISSRTTLVKADSKNIGSRVAKQSTEDAIAYAKITVPIARSVTAGEPSSEQTEEPSTNSSQSVEVHSLTVNGKTTTSGSVTVDGETKPFGSTTEDTSNSSNISDENVDIQIKSSGASQSTPSTITNSYTSVTTNSSSWNN